MTTTNQHTPSWWRTDLVRNPVLRNVLRVVGFGVLPAILLFWLYQNYSESRLLRPIPDIPVWMERPVQWPEELSQAAWVASIPLHPDPQGGFSHVSEQVELLKKAGIPAFAALDASAIWLGPEPNKAAAQHWLDMLEKLLVARTVQRPEFAGDMTRASVKNWQPVSNKEE